MPARLVFLVCLLVAAPAAANVAAAGMAARAGTPISFMVFLRAGIPATLLSMLVATAYLYLRYL